MKSLIRTTCLLLISMNLCCRDNVNRIAIIEDYLEAPIEKRSEFLDDNFQLVIVDDREFEKGRESISMLMEMHKSRFSLNESSTNLNFKLEGNRVIVKYEIDSWAYDCLTWSSLFSDTYVIINNKISHLTIQNLDLNPDADSIGLKIQKDFHSWAKKKNLGDSVLDESGFYKYLKVYCDSLTQKTTSTRR